MRQYTLTEVMTLLQGAKWEKDFSWSNPEAFTTTVMPYTFRLVDYKWGTEIDVFTSEDYLVDIFSGPEIDALWKSLATKPNQRVVVENLRNDFAKFLQERSV